MSLDSAGPPLTVDCFDYYADDLYGTGEMHTQFDLCTHSHRNCRGCDIELSFPVDDPRRLNYLWQIEIRLNNMNIGKTPSILDDLSTDQLSAEELFDVAVAEVIDRAYRATGTPMSDIPVDNDRLAALTLHEAWGFNSCPALEEHLESSTTVRHAIGATEVPDQSTLNRTMKRCEYYPETVREAATRAVHAVSRNGIPLPTDVTDSGIVGPQWTVENIPLYVENRALVNWMDFILPRILDGIHFHRGRNRSLSASQLLAAFAQAATTGSLESVPRVASWIYNLREVPSPDYLRRLPRSFTTKELSQTFRQLHNNFVEMAANIGFFEDPCLYAIDTTWIAHEKADGEKIINNPKQGDNKQGRCYAVLSAVNYDARFVFGIDLITNKGDTVQQFEGMFREVQVPSGVKGILADRGFHSAEAIRFCREVSPDGRRWIIRAQKKHNSDVAEEFKRCSERDVDSHRVKISMNEISPNPTLFIYKIPENAKKWDAGSYVGFLSDMRKDEIESSEVYDIYRRRWSQESSLAEIKNHFELPIESKSPELQLFLLNIQTVLYNIHTLINRARSPRLGLALDPTYHQTLNAVSEAVFTRNAPCSWPDIDSSIDSKQC
jgi:hypothetical protein